MAKNKNKTLNNSITILSAWLGFMLILFALNGVSWFHLGDFSFHTAMAYHGLLIPAWMMLILAYAQYIECSDFIKKLSGMGSVFASILVGIGSILSHKQGVSIGTVIQVTGMVIAEITALIIIIESFRDYFISSENSFNRTAWWTVSIALIGLSLATPLGHLAGAVEDLGMKFPIFIKNVTLLGQPKEDILGGYIGSHSHQIVAAFLAAGFTLPLIQETHRRQNVEFFMEKIGLLIIMGATIAQVVLYQYCAWFSWEPPTLFSKGPNGLPLDDFILVVMGMGMLLLIPVLFVKNKKAFDIGNYSKFVRFNIAVLLITYMISVIAIGLYIEFHEQYFGHGEGNASGILNDLAYIRAHLLFGFMIIPMLLGTLLNINLLHHDRQKWVITAFAILVVLTGLLGMFMWTFFLNSLLLKISIIFTTIFLLVFASLLSETINIKLKK